MGSGAGGRRLRLRARDLTWRSVDGHIVVLDLRRSVFNELNRTGSVLWEELAATSPTVEELTRHLCRSFDVENERAQVDVERFVQSLDDADLLEE